MRKRDKLTLAVLCTAHFVNDSYSSIIYPLLPLLAGKLGLSAAQVFWLPPIYSFSSSLLQPVYGFFSDRYARRAFAVLGPALTGAFVSLIGLAPSYAILIVLLVAGGVGIGSFHPQAAAMASRAAGTRKRIGMALFSALGTVGFAFGPFAITRVVSRFGLEHSYYIVGFGLAMSAVLYLLCPPLERAGKSEGSQGASESRLLIELGSAWKPLSLLYVITVIRSGLQITTSSYLPFLLGERGYDLPSTGNVMTIFLLLGGFGGLMGGLMAERTSGRAVTLYSGLLAGPLMMGSFLLSGPLSLLLLGLGGFCLLSTIPVNVAMAQELVPGQTSTVSALMMGAAWGIGALMPQALHPLVSIAGYQKTLVAASALTLLGALCAYWLPRDEAHRLKAHVELASPIGATGN
jgi:FSR family fosmidomycin resistance protein-like MFS transporter